MTETRLKGSVKRVAEAAAALGLSIELRQTPDTARTAEDAAAACGCEVARIVKSLIFAGARTGRLHLILASGANRVDPAAMETAAKEPLSRADPKDVRARTGFAIGGVAPIGHLEAPVVWMDRDLLTFETVWAAAGAPHMVFSVAPEELRRVTSASVVDLGDGARPPP